MYRIVFFLVLTLFTFSCSQSPDEPSIDQPSQEGKIKLANKFDFKAYYASIDGLDSKDLKEELHNLIDGNKVLPYTSFSFDVWDALDQTDEDPNNPNNVILIYTGRSQAKSYKDHGQNDNDSWNREHVWAKSRGFGGDPNDVKGPATDIHHIRAADRSVNTDRNNRYFDNGGAFHGEATACKYDSDSWEPRDAVKGDVARMLFYMAVRYEGGDGFADLELNEREPSNYALPYIGKLSALLEWHKKDPVDDFERKRNQVIFDIQGNRNPFVDHPEFVNYIW